MTIAIDPVEIEFSAIRAQGPGGQNVNKVSCAVQARFDIAASSLPPLVKARLLELRDARITQGGVVVIKAQKSRSLEQNKETRCDACRRSSTRRPRYRSCVGRPGPRVRRSGADSTRKRAAARSKRCAERLTNNILEQFMTSSSNSGLVYSTDGGRMCPECRRPVVECMCKARTAATGDGVVRVTLQTKGRGDKTVTLVKGFALDPTTLALLRKQLCTACNSGRSVLVAKALQGRMPAIGQKRTLNNH